VSLPRRLADWQLPEGVDRGLWDYVNDPALARAYDESLAGSSLFTCDLDFLLRHCPRGGQFIDLGCGTGRALLATARAGMSVLGVDLSAEMLAVARQKAEAARLRVNLLRANLTDLRALKDGRFDVAACLFSTLGMLVGQPARERAIREVHRLLRPGGKFILHVHNRWFNLWTPAGRRWVFSNLLRSMLGRDAAGDRVMPPHQGVGNLTLHLFTRREATRLLRQGGFVIEEIQPLSLRPDGRLPCPWWLGRLRAYGYLIAARR
jgi:SAM-dependent methyltransferase